MASCAAKRQDGSVCRGRALNDGERTAEKLIEQATRSKLVLLHLGTRGVVADAAAHCTPVSPQQKFCS
jgi:hypothetical protein